MDDGQQLNCRNALEILSDPGPETKLFDLVDAARMVGLKSMQAVFRDDEGEPICGIYVVNDPELVTEVSDMLDIADEEE